MCACYAIILQLILLEKQMDLNLDPSNLESLVIIGRRLNQADDIEATLQDIADVAANLTQSSGSSILLFEEETQQLYFAAAKDENREQLMQIRVPIDKSVAGRVYNEGNPLSITNATNDPLIFRVVDESLDFSTRNILAVPIIFGEEILGTLEVVNKKESHEFSSTDQAILEILASFTATAVQISVHQKKEKQINIDREELDRQKSDFIGITSHELRTPLGLILGHATFLNEIVKDEFQHEQLKAVIDNAEKLKDIIDSLSQAKGFETGTSRIRWQKTDLNKLVRSVVETYQDLARDRDINLSVSVPNIPIEIHCDAAKLSVAIGNLIKNGLIFSDNGQNVRINLNKVPGHAHISIIDTGIGIPAEELSLIFERFYQVEYHLTRSRGGMGLGLSVSKSIVESHGGYIWVDSKLGEGSTFTILLPIRNQII
jgi:signal transduction histidine kinase